MKGRNCEEMERRSPQASRKASVETCLTSSIKEIDSIDSEIGDNNFKTQSEFIIKVKP